MREIAVIENELATRRTELESTRGEASRLLAKQGGLEQGIRSLEAELQRAKNAAENWQVKVFKPDYSRYVANPLQGGMEWSVGECKANGFTLMRVDVFPSRPNPTDPNQRIAIQTKDAFKDTELWLNGVLDQAYKAGVLIVPRFMFTDREDGPEVFDEEIVNSNVDLFAAWVNAKPYMFAWIHAGFVGPWGEFWKWLLTKGEAGVRIARRIRQKIDPRLWVLYRRPDIIKSMGYSTPVEARAVKVGMKDLAFLAGRWSWGTYNVGEFANNPQAGVDFAIQIGGPFCTEPERLEAASKAPGVAEAIYRQFGATSYNNKCPGRFDV